MDKGLIALVFAGAIIFYAVAIIFTYESFAIYGALTVLLVGLSVIPLISKTEVEVEEEPVPRKKH